VGKVAWALVTGDYHGEGWFAAAQYVLGLWKMVVSG
jgi:hypothetical protein